MTKKLNHVAIIMDGNGRWAAKQDSDRLWGHENGVNSVRSTIEGAIEAGIGYITLYVFSTENWNRPEREVNGLMNILVSSLLEETDSLIKNGVKLNTIGNTDALPEVAKANLSDALERTSKGDKLVLTLALNYSGRWDITNAMQSIAKESVNGSIEITEIDGKLISSHLSTATLPDPDLMIRTSGEFRLSNFLLWELAYSELYFIDKLWPDFRKDDLFEAVEVYSGRERRYGKTSEQLEEK